MRISNQLSLKNPLLSLVVWLAVGLAIPAVRAQVTLHDNNSDATVNLGNSGTLGMNSWNINGIPQLSQQWFWYRVGSSGGQNPINTLSSATINNQNANSVSVTYAGSQFSVNVSYLLQGGSPSSYQADIFESISINNTSGGPLSLHFFQYSDFDLAGSPNGDQVTISQDTTVPPPNYYRAYQTKVAAATQLAETVDSVYANHAEAAIVGANGTLAHLNSGSPYTLNDVTAAGQPNGTDVTWAFEWDVLLDASGANSSIDILKDKRLDVAPVPEPGSLALLSLGMAVFALRCLRRSA